MSVTAHSREDGGLPGGLALNPAGVAWLVLAILSALPLFWIGLQGLATEWARPEYSHGPVIPVLSFYMFLREMKFVPPPAAPVTDRWPGVVVIALGLLVALLGNLVEIDDDGTNEFWRLANPVNLAASQYTLSINGNNSGAGSLGGSITIRQAAVPEPATWAMMLIGFGAVGFALRRRQRPVLAQLA